MSRVVVAGGAGFLGSHLCDHLIARGDTVVCLDDLSTGSRENVAHLLGPRLVRAGGHRCQPEGGTAHRRPRWMPCAIWPAPPLRRPTCARPSTPWPSGSEGTRRLLELAQDTRGALPHGQHQRDLRRPRGASPGRDLPGQCRPHRAAQRLRRGQAIRREPDHGHAPDARRQRRDRPHLQYLRPPPRPR